MAILARDHSRFKELKASGKLPSPTGVALAIMQMTQREDVALAAVGKVIQSDPALLGRILKLANSPVVGTQRPVTTAFDALTLLGLAVVRQLALGLSIVSNYSEGSCDGFDYRGFWSRSLATGCALQLLARHSKVLAPEDAFSCGMLSRVGYLALATLFPKDYGGVLRTGAEHSSDDTVKLEHERFATDHNQLTAALLEEWRLPKLMVDAACYHEQPDAGEFEAGSRTDVLARHLHFAAHWGLMCVSTATAREQMLPKFLTMGAELGLDKAALADMDEAVLHDWLEWGKVLNVTFQPFAPIGRDGKRAAQAPTATGIQTSTSATQSPLSILVADNDAPTRHLIMQLLSTAGHTTRAAANGREALELLPVMNPDVILCDWMLPGLNGLELLKALRGSQDGKEKYVIVLTAQDNEKTLVSALDAGADDYVIKPFGPRALEARIRAAHRIVALRRDVKREMQEVHRYIQELGNANQRWEEAAVTDVLTGLPNRRYAMERVKQAWASAVRGSRPLSIMLIDIDYFKNINDTFGHDEGDHVLHSIAAVLQESTRTEDVVCRVGGEEFLVICSDTTEIAAASSAGERLRAAVAKHTIVMHSGANARVTVSIGVAGRNESNTTIATLLKAADVAVYEAKTAGRNRVCLAR